MRLTKMVFTGLVCCLMASVASAQGPPIHYFHSGNLPPGVVGQGQLLRFDTLRGYFQPVSIHVPEGVRVSVIEQVEFDAPQPGPRYVGMQVGEVYQLKITQIPFARGHEIYPTIEIINRLYPPPGLATRFPVPIHLTQEELEFALSGRFVTRVIYLEDQETALPVADEPGFQRHFEVSPELDPLREADRLGRPMAILRMGSRVPISASEGGSLGFAQPPLIIYPAPQAAGARSDQSPAIERAPRHYPRIQLPQSTRRARDPYAVEPVTR